MEFNQKLQELRKQKGLTQNELANELFVSRTAISKWESGRGYPSIDSLKLIAKFFSITVDELLSSSEIIVMAKEEEKRKNEKLKDVIYGICDIAIILLAFLPIFAQRYENTISSVSLMSLDSIRLYIKILYIIAILTVSIWGVLELALQNINSRPWLKSKALVSVALSAACVLLFTQSLQPYPALIAFLLLSLKAIIQIIRK